jgi:cholinesterase
MVSVRKIGRMPFCAGEAKDIPDQGCLAPENVNSLGNPCFLMQRFTAIFLALLLGGLMSPLVRGAADSTAAANSWQTLFVFGDSYSDSGAGYVDINGPTAVVYLAQHLGLSLAAASAGGTVGQGLNFAVSGATTGGGDGQRTKDALLGRGVQTQVLDFVAQVKKGAIVFDSTRTLFFVAAGLNDRKLPTAQTVENLERAIEMLHRAGGRCFLLASLPEKIPAFSTVSVRLNPALREIPSRLNSRLPGVDVRLSQWGVYFDEVMLHPAAHGITNTKDACAGRAIFDEDPTPVGPPDQYYYYHSGHPSTAVHRVVGEGLYHEAQAFAAKW